MVLLQHYVGTRPCPVFDSTRYYYQKYLAGGTIPHISLGIGSDDRESGFIVLPKNTR